MRTAASLPLGIPLAMVLAAPAAAVTIHDVQFTLDAGGNSPYLGQTVTLTGAVTSTDADGYVIAETSGPWSGVRVYSLVGAPEIGDEVRITGVVNEYFGMTEIGDLSSYALLSTDNDIAPVVVDAADAGQEMYESVLVTVADVTVDGLMTFGEWSVADGTGSIRCDDLDDYTYFPRVGDQLDSLTGVVFYSFSDFKIEPRYTNDITGGVIPHFAIGGDVVTMNASLDVVPSAYVEILGDRIVSIGTTPPAGIPVVETNGLVFPGLIDAHDHGRYDVLDHIPFGQRFDDRYEWQADVVYTAFNAQYDDILHYGGAYAQETNIYRLFETRALCAGTTTVEGDTSPDVDHQGIIVGIAERHPNRIFRATFPLSDTQAEWNQRQTEHWERFVVHLAEGVNASSLQEFYTWQSWGMLDQRTTIIHGVPLGAPELQAMAAADANLVWSPMSNIVLYGDTADIPTALAAGVNVALAPDWTPSGGRHLLEELKFADELNQSQWGGLITPAQFAQFVTCNAARALGAEDHLGEITTGYQADLVVIPGNPANPYPALLAAESSDVLLTVVSGRPMYGDPELIDQFPFLNLLEDIDVCGTAKTLATRVIAHNIPDSAKTLASTTAELETAYDAATPVLCAFVPVDPVCADPPDGHFNCPQAPDGITPGPTAPRGADRSCAEPTPGALPHSD